MSFNRIIQIVSISAVLLLMIASCKKEKVEPNYPPQLVCSPDTIYMHNYDTTKLYLSMSPSGSTNFTITSTADWLSVSRTTGTIQNDIQEIQLITGASSLQQGTYMEEITVISDNGGTAKSIVCLTVGNEELMFLPNTLSFNYNTSLSSIDLKSFSTDNQYWTLGNHSPYLTVNPTSGTLMPGETITLNVQLDRTSFNATGIFSDSLLIQYANGNHTSVAPVEIKVLIETKTFLTSDVVDAEFDEAHDRIVYVSSSPLALKLITHPDNPTYTSIPLTYFPLCVSIAPGGNEAVVGHDGKISVVDLTTGTVTHEYSSTCEAFDIVHGGNGWAYVFPANQQWTNIRCIDLATGIESLSTGMSVYGDTKAKLLPGGGAIYGADTHSSPSDIEKYEISGGTAAYLYDSPYHGDYPFNGDLWFTKNNNKIISRAGTMLSTSSVQSQDMLYWGTISLPNISTYAEFISGVYHSLPTNKIFGIIEAGYSFDMISDSALTVFDATTLGVVQRIPYEPYISPLVSLTDPLMEAEGKFVFGNAAGTKAYVLTQAPVGTAIPNEWALQILDVN